MTLNRNSTFHINHRLLLPKLMKCIAYAFTLLTLPIFLNAQTIKNVRIAKGNVVYEIPTGYELAQIAFALSDTANRIGKSNIYENIINKDSEYHKEVLLRFDPYKNHKLIRQINRSLKKSLRNYIYNLHVGYNSEFRNQILRKNNKYPTIHKLMYKVWGEKRKHFRMFAKESRFIDFYESKTFYYQNLLNSTAKLLQTEKMVSWLEGNFPLKYDSVIIVVSPLMGGLNFTKRFEYKGKKYARMWVPMPNKELLETPSNIQIGQYIGAVFTEIDHNYINPVTVKYKSEVDQIMGEKHRVKWIKNSTARAYYKSGYAVFNEYMTHATYLIYTLENFSPDEQAILEKSKINTMENQRKFYRFGDFYSYYKKLYLNRAQNQTVTDLYTQILKWCQDQNQN